MFQLPREIIEETKKYRQALAELKAGKISADRFKGIRVPWGIYSHRGGEVFMTRIRIPAGLVTAAQLRALAGAARKYGNGQLHLTTRQDIQIHQVKIEATAEIMEYLRAENLSPRGGGGNTVRNVVACEAAGICPYEVFDVAPQAVALTEYLLAQESSFLLPRKFKIALAGCPRGWRSYRLNDVGLLAKIENGERGYQVFAGGGMGAQSRVARELERFIPRAEVGRVVAAVKNVYNRHGNRKNKHHNRLRFLIADLGWDKFTALYQQERQALPAIDLNITEPGPRAEETSEIPQIEDAGYQQFLKYNVQPQKQKGYVFISLRIPRGEIAADKLEALAALGQYEFRTNQNQNLIIAWVKKQEVYNLYQKINAILTDFLYPRTLVDIVACKGAQTCNLGICNSPGLAQELEQMIAAEFGGTRVFTALDIKLNGCPNACAQHPLGKISFYGLVKRVNNHPLPFYKVLLGARKQGEEVKLAEEVGELPAKNIPAFLREFLHRLEEELPEGAKVSDVLTGRGKVLAAEIINKYTAVPAYEENRDFYVDWGKSEAFSLAGIGPGECGVGVLDMIEADLREAKTLLQDQKFYQALVAVCRALLVVKGLEPRTDSEILTDFRISFVAEGIIAPGYNNVAEKALALSQNELPREEAAAYVSDLYQEVSAAYQGMDSNFKFPLRTEVTPAAAKVVPVAQGQTMDLRGVTCPINYVKAKLKMETMQVGEKLLLYLDPGEPIQNVPASFRNDGQTVARIEAKGNYFEVLVIKEV